MTDMVSGAGRLVQHAVYLYRGVTTPDDRVIRLGASTLRVTASPETAVREGLPPSAHRPPLYPVFGGPAVVRRLRISGSKPSDAK